jgi:hypothetical protein
LSIPEDGHLHIEVTEKGKDPTWTEFNQIFPGEFKFKWKIGDEIHIAFDLPQNDCKWGKDASDYVVLSGDVSIFEMEGEIKFSNIDKTINIGFTPSLKDRLPELE